MSGFSKKVEVTANLAIIVVAIMLGYVLVKGFIFKPQPEIPKPRGLGKKISLPGVDWQQNGNTLIFVLRQGCDYCTESSDFYKRIMNDATIKSKVRFMAVFPHSVEEGKTYLNEAGLAIADVRQYPLSLLQVNGTPSVLLVDSQGVVKNIWVGKLSQGLENEAMASLVGL